MLVNKTCLVYSITQSSCNDVFRLLRIKSCQTQPCKSSIVTTFCLRALKYKVETWLCYFTSVKIIPGPNMYSVGAIFVTLINFKIIPQSWHWKHLEMFLVTGLHALQKQNVILKNFICSSSSLALFPEKRSNVLMLN